MKTVGIFWGRAAHFSLIPVLSDFQQNTPENSEVREIYTGKFFPSNKRRLRRIKFWKNLY